MTFAIERTRARVVSDWARGLHLPDPVLGHDGWRCHRCGRRLRAYTSRQGQRRLRHNWRDR